MQFQETKQPNRPEVEIKVESKTVEPETPKRVHGFSRLGQTLGDPEMAVICEKGAIDIPLNHPMEQAAEMVADTIEFVRTPGGKTAFEAIKKGLSGIFGG